MKKILFLNALLILSVVSAAQMHDVDSLYDNDPEFKRWFKKMDEDKDIFDSDRVMNMTIESDFKNLVKQKYKDEYQPAKMTYYINDTMMLKRNIEIKPRGNMRKGSCFFPPLKLNFKKSEVLIKEMKEFDKMKMVLDCKKGKMYEQYLLSEYMVYKLQNILTEYSYRVRLMHVKYVDTSEKYKTDTRYAFLIESKEQMAERLNAIAVDTKNIRDQLTDLPTLINAYLFQYLIGNTDWSIPGRHNIQLIKSNDPTLSKPYVIPYDFDYAGMVNTTYAIPDPQLGIESVRDRVYRGVCLPEEEVRAMVKYYIDKKSDVYALYESSELLDKNNKRSSINYLDEFYKTIEGDYSLKRNILESCRE